MKKNFMLLLGLILIIFTVGCSKQEEKTDKEEVETITPIQEEPEELEEPEEPQFKNVFPLTGIGTNESEIGRPFAVMINNHPKARPQSGLHQADVVFEVIAEADVTRFLAIYQSEKPEIIGPVRSSRDYFIELSQGFDALYVAHGWSPEAKKILNNGSVDNINGMVYDGTLFWRANHNVAPHNSYISSENIAKGAAEKGYSMERDIKGYKFLSEDEVNKISGTPAEHIRVSYSSRDTFTSVFDFNLELGRYERSSNGKQTVDRETETPILIDNILILEMKHQLIDDYGRNAVDLSSGGKGYLLQKGKAKEIEWKNIDGRIVPVFQGKEVGLVPGKTWINIIPTTPGIDGVVSFGQ